MGEQGDRAVARMGWDELEESLQPADRGSPGTPSSEKALRDYFGDEEFEALRTLAAQGRASRSRGPASGNVVFLPGIMGSSLATVGGGDEDPLWLNFLRLVTGQIKRLRLSDDGSSEADPDVVVKPTGLDKRTYARAILRLKASWTVEPFPFDWRRDIDHAADALSAFIEDRFGDQPVHLVAHSMGGLVCRTFIRRHKAQWDAMAGRDGSRGGRLVMLGTPNYGSFAIVQAMTGDETMVKLLAAADLTNSLSEVLAVIDTFVGSYQMLPWQSKLHASLSVLFRQGNWGSCPVSERHLARALTFQQEMGGEETVDPGRMVYIAGCNRETVSDLKIIAPGEFDYVITHDGDGRVPHALGLLPGVPAYYVEESHGSLPKNAEVLAAVDELLEHGRTAILSDRPILSRGIRPEAAAGGRPRGNRSRKIWFRPFPGGPGRRKPQSRTCVSRRRRSWGRSWGRAGPLGSSRRPEGRGSPRESRNPRFSTSRW